MTTLGLKNVNMLSKEQYDTIAEPVTDELWAISGSGFGFPSSNYEDLELGASGTKYTAPANGWFYISKGISANQYFTFNNVTKKYSTITAPSSNNSVVNIFPCQKGDVIEANYTASGSTYGFRFIYSEGE